MRPWRSYYHMGECANVQQALRDRSIGQVFPCRTLSVSAAFTRACGAHGIEDLHFHDLRHRATGDPFRTGLDIRVSH
jgi:integrase